MKKLYYVTYQSFPAQTANSIQTISNIKYHIRNNYHVSLFFPLREKTSSAKLKDLHSFYSFDDKFIVRGIKHYLPFGRMKLLEKLSFHISHFLWSFWVVFCVLSKEDDPEYYLTRSDWIFLFLSLKNKNVIFECHQFSKIRKLILNVGFKKKNAKIIFLNQELLKNSGFADIEPDKIIVAHNGYDEDFLTKNDLSKSNEIIFIGNLKRFNEERGLKMLIDAFTQTDIGENYRLTIVGGPKKEAANLEKYKQRHDLHTNINIVGPKTRSEISGYLKDSSIGVLLNSSSNIHSYLFSSPLKYFEYIFNKLKVIAVDFPAHRELPYSENIVFFKENNIKSLVEAIKNTSKIEVLELDTIRSLTVDERVKKIIAFANS
ncbi:glycosyltransferase [Acidimicrobiaceae bacterium]|nr:glycosyltransferase [Acidimicrobiaceae bacterium]